uniref:Serpentine receptor class gamma n=1 Tax=Panagrolaimus sp. JU765 TaxID=591449 RepID=A0AC34RTG1_9BILA
MYSSPFFTLILVCFCFDFVQYIVNNIRTKVFVLFPTLFVFQDAYLASFMYYVISCSSATEILVHTVICFQRYFTLKRIHLKCYREVVATRSNMSKLDSHEVALFTFGLFLLALLIARSVYQVTIIVALTSFDGELYRQAQYYFPSVAIAYAISGSTALLVISKNIRHDFIKMYHLRKLCGNKFDTVSSYNSDSIPAVTKISPEKF